MSVATLREHRALWSRKPVLAELYRVWFDLLLERAPAGARVLEVGAGPGFLSQEARARRPDLRWVASDLTPTGWNDLVADATRLPIATAGVDLVAALDLVHHLAFPREFFAEVARVLRPGGALAAVEPWVSPLSYPIYRWLHQEGCTLGLDPWRPFAAGAAKQAFDGDAAVPWRIVRDVADDEWTRIGLRPPRVRPLNGFGYLLSLGFRPQSLLPRRLAGAFNALDRVSRPLAPAFAMRALIVWERPA